MKLSEDRVRRLLENLHSFCRLDDVVVRAIGMAFDVDAMAICDVYGITYEVGEWSNSKEYIERLEAIATLTAELMAMFESEEESDGGRKFHPVTINSCRTQHINRLGELIPALTKMVKEHIEARKDVSQ